MHKDKRRMVSVQHVKLSAIAKKFMANGDYKKSIELSSDDFNNLICIKKDFDCIAYAQMRKILKNTKNKDFEKAFLIIEFDVKENSATVIKERIFKNGITVIGESTYLRFGRSASMARGGIMVFVNAEYISELTERCTLGMENYIFNKLDTNDNASAGTQKKVDRFSWLSEDKKLSIPKYESYKGLVFSGGYSVNELAYRYKEKTGENIYEQIKLSAANVIVVDDYKFNYNPNKEEQKEKKDIFLWACEKNNLDNISLKNTGVKINAFDGEGLMTKEFAKKLSKLICGEEMYYSYQIRLPFVKGMLHGVDFKAFLSEHGCEKITDIAGYEHNVKDVDIILTKSMFKAYDWYNRYRNKNDLTKPFLDVYFEKFDEYKHSMFICRTNKVKEERLPYNTLNYQILHTLGMTQEDFKTFVDESLQLYKSAKKPCNWITVFLNGMDNLYEPENEEETNTAKCEESANMEETAEKESPTEETLETDEVITEDSIEEQKVLNGENSDKQFFSGYTALEKVVEKNPDFIYSTYGKEKISKMLNSMKDDIMKGKLITRGGTYILSADLMLFLKYLAEKCTPDNKNKEKKIKVDLLYDNNFYCADYGRDGKEYALFRNPHMSRTEHVFMRCYKKEASELELKKEDSELEIKNERNQYLSHLSGIVMINPQGLVQNRMGGADFDGDIVNIVDNKVYLSSLKESILKDLKEMRNYGKQFIKDSKENDTEADANVWKSFLDATNNIQTADKLHQNILPLADIPSFNPIVTSKKDINDIDKYNKVQYDLFKRAASSSIKIGQYSYMAFSKAVKAYGYDAKDRFKRMLDMIKFTILAGVTLDSVKNGVSISCPKDLKVLSDNYEPFIKFKKQKSLNRIKEYLTEDGALIESCDTSCNMNMLPLYVKEQMTGFRRYRANTINIKDLIEIEDTGVTIDNIANYLEKLSNFYKSASNRLNYVSEHNNYTNTSSYVDQKIREVLYNRYSYEEAAELELKLKCFAQTLSRAEIRTIKEKLREEKFELHSENKRNKILIDVFEDINLEKEVIDELSSLKFNKSALIYYLLQYALITGNTDITDNKNADIDIKSIQSEIGKVYSLGDLQEKCRKYIIDKCKVLFPDESDIEKILFVACVNHNNDYIRNKFIWHICGKEILKYCKNQEISNKAGEKNVQQQS